MATSNHDLNEMHNRTEAQDGHNDLDKELFGLFSAFDDISASDDLEASTLAAILAAGDNTNGSRPSDAASEEATDSAITSIPGGRTHVGSNGRPANTKRNARSAKWRVIRVAAVAACLVLALSGGIAYATPTSYYDVIQDDTSVTLGVNCFGITVTATSDDEAGQSIIESANLDNVPYEDAVKRTIDSMEQRNPAKPIEYGPQGGAHEFTKPANEPNVESNTEPNTEPQAQSDPGNADDNTMPKEQAELDGPAPQDVPEGQGDTYENQQPSPQEPQADPINQDASQEGMPQDQALD